MAKGSRMSDAYRARLTRLITLLFLFGSLFAVLPDGAGASNSQTTSARAHGVVQDFTVHYNTGNCSNGTKKIQITSGFLHWWRDSTSRNVKVGHIYLVQGYRTCSGGADPRSRSASVYPAWGCGGRCSNQESESRGVTVSWGYVLRDGTANAASGSGHGHITDGNGNAVGDICTRVILHTSGVACQ